MYIFALLFALAILSPAPVSAGDYDCPSAALPPLALPNVQKTLHEHRELTIVALGSSSTAGSRASDMAHTYPAVLQAALEKALPDAHVAVLNRGIGGQDAVEMLARLDHDALASAPSLVIWQVGANGAMRGMDPGEFQDLVATGVHRLQAAGADVILMDNQRSPAVLGSPKHAKIDQALADVAGREHARLFARGRLMDLWHRAGHPYAEFVDADGIHHNDRGYACLARAVAHVIVAGLSPAARSVQASQ